MRKLLRRMEINSEQDVVRVRQAARDTAALLDFDARDQTRIATAVSEIGRNALKFGGGGIAEFAIAHRAEGELFEVTIRDEGQGISNLQDILDGNFVSESGSGMGLVAAKRLMDEFSITSDTRGTVVKLGRLLVNQRLALDPQALAKISEKIVKTGMANPYDEFRAQNQELLATLDELRKQQDVLTQLNRELEETNRGVVALYSELDDKSRSLQRVSEVKTRLLSNMSHEFRTPVASILALSRLLIERSDGELTAEQERQVNFILKAAANLRDMVDDLLDLAKVEAGKITVRPSEFNIEDLFGALRGMLRPLLVGVANVNLLFEQSPDLPRLNTDEGKLAQILRNLVSNALKYTESGEIVVRARMAPDETIELSVRDTGMGIAPEHLDTIFEEFTQIESPLQKRVKGTGLGLPLSRTLAALLGGTLRVESEVGKGSTFSVRIPTVHAQAAKPLPNLSVETPAVVLIIDDDEISRYLLRDILKSSDFTFLEAANGAEGLRIAKEKTPSVIFLDLLMPELNGFEVLDALKKDPSTKDIPVIINSTELMGEKEMVKVRGRAASIIKKDFASRESASRTVLQALRQSLGKDSIHVQ